MTTKKRLTLYTVYSILSMLLVFGLINNVTDDDALYFGAPYVLAVVFMIIAYRLKERHIWLYPVVNVVLVLIVGLVAAKEETVFLFGHMTWFDSFVFVLLAFSMIYLLPVVLASLLYAVIRWLTRKIQGDSRL